MKNIFKYELIQLFRDKKTIIFIFILPLIIFPIINGGLVYFTKSRVKSIASEKATVQVKSNLLTDNLFSDFKDSTITAEFTPQIADNKDSLLALYPAVIDIEEPDTLAIPLVTVFYSSKDEKKGIIAHRIIKLVEKLRKDNRNLRFKEIGIEDYQKSLELSKVNIAGLEETENYKYAKTLTISLILVLFFGTYTLANYVILGEKDNKTMETLLTSGAARNRIILGKMSIIFSAGIIMSVLELLSFYFYSKWGGLSNFNIYLDFQQILLFSLVTLAVSVLIASVGIFISCRMKSSTVGQMIMTPLFIVILLFAFGGTFDGIVVSKGLLLIPVLNAAGVMKAIIMNNYNIVNVSVAAVSSLGYGFFFIKQSVAFLNSEGILENDSEQSLAGRSDKSSFAYLSFAVLVVFYLQVGGYLQGRDIVSGLIYSQVFILGLAAVFILKLAGLDLKKSFRFKGFKLQYLFLALFFGFFGRYPISFIKEGFGSLFPIPKLMEEASLLDTGLGEIPFGLVVLIVGFLPAIFEELVFRGAFVSLLENNRSKLKVSLIVGVLFGIMHLNVFTFLETGLLGVLLTYLTLKSGSIIPSMIFHAINNSSSMVMMQMMEKGELSDGFTFIMENQIFIAVVSLVTVALIVFMMKEDLVVFKNIKKTGNKKIAV